MIAVSLNVGGGVRLIKPANCTCARKTLQTQRGRRHGAGCVRQWFRTAESLWERRYENWNTHTQVKTVKTDHSVYQYADLNIHVLMCMATHDFINHFNHFYKRGKFW